MKRIKIVITCLLATMLMGQLQSCTNLEEKPYSTLPDNEFYNTEDEYIMVAGRVYTYLVTYTHYFNIWGTVQVSTDETLSPMREGNLWLDGGVWRDLHAHTFNPAHDGIRQTWNFIFEGITLCNEILYQFDKSQVEFPTRDNIIAEVLIMRAWFYLNAIDLFGEVPFSTDFADATLPMPKSRKEVYSFIEKEVKENIDLLADYPTGNNYGRATKAFAHTILAKLYINAQEWIGEPKWAETIEQCDAIIDMSNFIIEPDYFTNFKADNDGSKENIFVIVYDKVYTSQDWHEKFRMHQLTLHDLSTHTFGIKDFCWNGFCTTGSFYRSFDDQDARKEMWLAGPQFDINGQPILFTDGVQLNYKPDITSLWDFDNPAKTDDGARFAKYEYENGLQGECMNNDYVIYRYADILMMKGEALVRQGKSGEAVELFNEVRSRTGLEDYTADQLTLDEILAERGREFAWEGVRRQDLIRFGRWTEAWDLKPESPEYTKIFPTPSRAIMLNENLNETPGYTY